MPGLASQSLFDRGLVNAGLAQDLAGQAVFLLAEREEQVPGSCGVVPELVRMLARPRAGAVAAARSRG